MRHFIGVLAVAGLLAVIAPYVANEFYLRTMFMICVYYLCAAGMNILLGLAGQKSLGQAGLFAAGAYTTSLLGAHFGVNAVLALLAAIPVAALFGVAIALPSLRAKGPSLAMVTIAFGIVIEKVVTDVSDVFGGPTGIYNVPTLKTWSGKPFGMLDWFYLSLVLAVVAHLLMRNLIVSRFGRAFRSIQADEIAAAALGVAVYRLKVLAFVIAAVTCGLAGAIVAEQNQYINSDFINFNLSVFILLLVMIGGSGSIYGPLLGTVALELISVLLARWSWLEHLSYGVLLLVALYLMPKGLTGVGQSLIRRFKKTPEKRVFSVAEGELPAAPTAGEVGSTLLTVARVNKNYGGIFPARDVSLSITRGNIHALIGPNGAGKSTMINMLTGVVRPGSGTIHLRDTEISRRRAHEIAKMGVARTFQNLRLFRDMTVFDNVLLGRHCRMRNGFFSALLGTPSSIREEREARRVVEGILAYFGLQDFAEVAAGDLAYGLQRRVELARAIASQPDLLLLDEPAAGLNPQETKELGQLLLDIRDRGFTILLVEHHMDLVMEISDHVIVLDYGEKIAEGAPEVVQLNPRVLEAYLGPDFKQITPAQAEEA